MPGLFDHGDKPQELSISDVLAGRSPLEQETEGRLPARQGLERLLAALGGLLQGAPLFSDGGSDEVLQSVVERADRQQQELGGEVNLRNLLMRNAQRQGRNMTVDQGRAQAARISPSSQIAEVLRARSEILR